MRLKDKFELEVIRNYLLTLAYENMNLSPVTAVGQFSIRGGVVDIWPDRYQNPARLDFFGNRLESIYTFDVLTHKPLRQLKELTVLTHKFSDQIKVKWPQEVVEKFEKLFFSDIKPGDLIVHIDHGVGRFLRIEERNLEGKKRYYLIVSYAKGEKLYIPVGQIDRLTKYIGIGGKKPTLNHLGTATWEKTKINVKKDLIVVAKGLLKLYALREKKRRTPFLTDSILQKELADDFPYELTPSQEQAWHEIAEDLESDRPMDRLLVGDVGFGKTEMSLRAAFKVVQSGYQVAVLVPTSILAEQHYRNFTTRLDKFGLTVARMSRFGDKKEESTILAGLETGGVDIVIGTHRLLGEAIKFRKLGLLIIDEEHRFGVMHKERLKKLHVDTDVLTMSATPIPRTLHLSLIRIRDLSLISDPPLGRLAIKNFIGPFNTGLIKTAIEQELSRGGQVYYLCNRIAAISGEVKKIMQAVPTARLAVAHSKMTDQELEETMEQFMNGKFEVLVSTTIIGSGLDIPNVNTIIIKDSQKLGLADLYQLRGRVGRGNVQAYAYIFFPKGFIPRGQSRERFEALSESDTLGSGFNLAERDLEIRGAGNILGVEQHGAVSLVGFELYLKLLSQATEKLRQSI